MIWNLGDLIQTMQHVQFREPNSKQNSYNNNNQIVKEERRKANIVYRWKIIQEASFEWIWTLEY